MSTKESRSRITKHNQHKQEKEMKMEGNQWLKIRWGSRDDIATNIIYKMDLQFL